MAETYEGWTALELAMPPEVAEDDPRLEVLAVALFELGAAGLETKEVNGRVVVVASFAPEAGPDVLDAAADEALLVAKLPRGEVSTHPYAQIDWATHWRQHFHAISFGEGQNALWIVPTWIDPPEGAANILRLDPSSAFGTGLHETTAMCLERIVELSPISTLLDVGTGTGILALAALRLGGGAGTRAVATDNDPEALRVAAENAERNELKDRIQISGKDPGELGEKFDVVVANILALPLVELAPELAKVVKPGGLVVLSGITRAQVDHVAQAYQAEGLIFRGAITRGEWARLDLEARSGGGGSAGA